MRNVTEIHKKLCCQIPAFKIYNPIRIFLDIILIFPLLFRRRLVVFTYYFRIASSQ